jgi:hypothetical protein
MQGAIGKKVSGGIIISFVILVVIFAVIAGLYMQVYINSMVLGSIFQVAQDSNFTTNVPNSTITLANATNVSLGNENVLGATLLIVNQSNRVTINQNNFTIDLNNGFIELTTGPLSGLDSAVVEANYTYFTYDTSDVPISEDTRDFLSDTETSYFGNTNSVLSGVSFGASLIPIAIILLVFAAFIVGGMYVYRRYKGKGGDMGY